MKIALLCKRHNHRKVLEILEAFREQNISVCGLVALERREPWPSFEEIVRKIYYRRKHARGQSISRLSMNTHAHLSGNGKFAAHALETRNGHMASRPQQDFSAHNDKPKSESIDTYARAHGIPLIPVSDLNGAACAAALRELQPDLMILGGTPIIRENILAAPRMGTLNVHMAWLPGIRGMNVAEWSVYCDAPIAVTVHFVDKGIDTGAVLYREQINISECRSIAAMRQKLSAQQHLALARATRLFIEQRIQPEAQTQASGKQYYIMHERLKQVVERKLRAG